MAHDQLEAPDQTTRRGGVRFMAAGVAGACVLGVGLGLWARPSSVERGEAPAPAKPEVEAALSDRRLQIVLDDTPAPIGQPLEVMPADTPGLLPADPQPSPSEPQLPKGPPAGLMKVDAPVAAPAAAAVVALPAVIAAARPEPRPEPRSEPRPEPKPQPKLEKPKAKIVVAKAEKPKAEKKKPETKVAKAEPKAKTKEPAKRLAKAEAPKKKVDVRKERTVKLAKAEPARKTKARTEPKAEKPPKLTKLVKAVKSAPKKLKATATATAERKKQRDLQLAEAREAKRAKTRAEKLAQAKAKAKPPVEKASTPKKKPVPRGEGAMRVARNDSCVSSDPGEALVCADPRLNQRDRQLQRALRDAEAAGVPASALRRQQERLRQARAAAARDGSWAVEDVYEARIAELNDLARDARDY